MYKMEKNSAERGDGLSLTPFCFIICISYIVYNIQIENREGRRMHAIEKILAKNSGRREVKTGEIVTAKVDFAEINDLYLQTVYSFYEMGGEKVWDREAGGIKPLMRARFGKR